MKANNDPNRWLDEDYEEIEIKKRKKNGDDTVLPKRKARRSRKATKRTDSIYTDYV